MSRASSFGSACVIVCSSCVCSVFFFVSSPFSCVLLIFVGQFRGLCPLLGLTRGGGIVGILALFLSPVLPFLDFTPCMFTWNWGFSYLLFMLPINSSGMAKSSGALKSHSCVILSKAFSQSSGIFRPFCPALSASSIVLLATHSASDVLLFLLNPYCVFMIRSSSLLFGLLCSAAVMILWDVFSRLIQPSLFRSLTRPVVIPSVPVAFPLLNPLFALVSALLTLSSVHPLVFG